MDPESRELIESAYRTGPEYQQPVVDDFGYGDPGYSDPSYEGPKAPYHGSAFPGAVPDDPAPWSTGGSGYRQAGDVPGNHVPETRDPAPPARHSRSYSPPSGAPAGLPVTGAQQARPGTGYPDQWYDHPRLDDRVAGDARRAPADPRLDGMKYGGPRYDDPDPRSSRDPGHAEPLDDESWYRELRRSAPAYPQRPSSPPPGSTGPRGAGSGGAARSGAGLGSAGLGGAGLGGAGLGEPQRRPDGPRSGRPRGPQLSARPDPGPGSPPAAPGTNFLAAPVGLLTPPDGTRFGALRDADFGAAPAGLLAPPDERPGTATARPPGGGTALRPGHGLDGPEITASWPVQPEAGDLVSYDDFWRDDEDEEYTGLFGDRGAEFERADAKQAAARQGTTAKRAAGRRRGRSSDHRLWLGLGGVVVVAAASIVGVLKYEFPSHSGPAHAMTTPPSIGAYTRTMDLERQTDVAQLRDEVVKMSSGQAHGVVSAVYEMGNSQAGNTAQIIMFIGGHLAHAAPAASITSFTQKFPGAHVVGAGALGGKAACVQEGAGSNAVAMCAWFDDDSFGEVVSPTMNASALGEAMQKFRPAVEHLTRK